MIHRASVDRLNQLRASDGLPPLSDVKADEVLRARDGRDLDSHGRDINGKLRIGESNA